MVIMTNVLCRHHDKIPLDQFEILVLADDAGLHHPADVIDGEGPAGKSFGGPGDGDVHDEIRLLVPHL